MGPPGLEPGTNTLWVYCSNQLSYRPSVIPPWYTILNSYIPHEINVLSLILSYLKRSMKSKIILFSLSTCWVLWESWECVPARPYSNSKYFKNRGLTLKSFLKIFKKKETLLIVYYQIMNYLMSSFKADSALNSRDENLALIK